MKDYSVLLVDNNPLFTQLLVRYFQNEEKVRVLHASNEDFRAIELVEQNRPEVVLVALDESRKNGLELIRRLRAMLNNGWIIAIASLDAFACPSEVIDAGADELFAREKLNSEFLITLHNRLPHRRPIMAPRARG